MIAFETLNINDVPWESLSNSENLNVFQSLAWLKFVAETQKATPIVSAIRSEENLLGFFTGLITQKLGFKILGSPLRGWSTDFMGFNLYPQASKREILKAFPKFVFQTLGCHYFELIDPTINKNDIDGLPFDIEILPRFVLDLTKSEDELFKDMKGSCRNYIRQSIRNGVTIEEATDITFAEDYYSQLKEVFAKQSLEPPYSLERLIKMIELLLPTGKLLLLRAKEPSGKCIATGIFLASNRTCVWWGEASWRQYQSLRPNEPMVWYGMKYWKERGVKDFHLGGGWELFKSKFGSQTVQIIRLMKAKYVVLDLVRNFLMKSQNPRLRNWAIRRV